MRNCRTSEELGQLFRSELAKIDSEMIELIRGKGLLNAIIIKPKKRKKQLGTYVSKWPTMVYWQNQRTNTSSVLPSFGNYQRTDYGGDRNY